MYKQSLGICVVVGVLLCSFSANAQEPPPPEGTDSGDQESIEDSAGDSGDQESIEDSTDGRKAKNSIWLEGLGSALGYSLNYERLVIDQLGVRVGFSYLSFGATSTDSNGETASAKVKIFIFPITASYIGIASKSKTHILELGAGATLIFASGSSSGLGMSTEGSGAGGFGNFFGGYRIQPARGGFQFRVGLMGIFGPGLSFSSEDPGKWGLIPWGYISLGGSF